MAYFTDRTYENILKEMLAMAPKGVDVRQGSIYYDSVSSCALKLANFYVDAGLIIELTSLWTAPGEWLDQKAGSITWSATLPLLHVIAMYITAQSLLWEHDSSQMGFFSSSKRRTVRFI